MFHVPHQYRVRNGRMASSDAAGNNGVFVIPYPGRSMRLRTVASDGDGWEHVSVSMSGLACPTWPMMAHIKRMFWDAEDVVIQYHPAESQYVNCHPFTLHLWRPVGQSFPTPPAWMVGPTSIKE